jgi:hypothetical protein
MFLCILQGRMIAVVDLAIAAKMYATFLLVEFEYPDHVRMSALRAALVLSFKTDI